MMWPFKLRNLFYYAFIQQYLHYDLEQTEFLDLVFVSFKGIIVEGNLNFAKFNMKRLNE